MASQDIDSIDDQDDEQELPAVDSSESLPQPDAGDSDDDSDPVQVSLPGQSITASPINPLVAEYLANKQAMAQAQGASNTNQLYANLARAGGTLSHAMSRSLTPMDQSGYNALDASANQPVKNIQAQQASDLDALKGQATMLAVTKEQAESDPNSPQSLAFRKSVEKLAPGIAAQYGDDWQNVTAADSDKIMKPIELKEQMDARKQTAMLSKQTQFGQNQDKSYTQMRHDLETFRGNQAAQQAAVKVQNAQTALAMVQNKDPNTLTTSDLNLLADEMGKIATGGVPGEGQVKALVPNTYATKLADIQTFLGNKPTNAQAADFIQHNMSYLKDMTTVAQNTLDSYRSNIAKGYKNRVKPEDYQEAMQDYGINGAQPTQTTQPTPAQQSPGFVKMKDPQGNVRNVPVSQRDAALAAGGTLVQ